MNFVEDLRKIQNGDDSYWDSFRNGIFKFICKLSQTGRMRKINFSDFDIDDITQDVIIRIWKDLPSINFDFPERVFGFIKNQCKWKIGHFIEKRQCRGILRNGRYQPMTISPDTDFDDESLDVDGTPIPRTFRKCFMTVSEMICHIESDPINRRVLNSWVHGESMKQLSLNLGRGEKYASACLYNIRQRWKKKTPQLDYLDFEWEEAL